MSKKILMISLAIIIVVVVCEPTNSCVGNRNKFLDGILEGYAGRGRVGGDEQDARAYRQKLALG